MVQLVDNQLSHWITQLDQQLFGDLIYKSYGLVEKYEKGYRNAANEFAVYDDRFALTAYHRIEQIKVESRAGYGKREQRLSVLQMRCVLQWDSRRFPAEWSLWDWRTHWLSRFPDRLPQCPHLRLRLTEILPAPYKAENLPLYPPALALRYQCRHLQPCLAECP